MHPPLRLHGCHRVGNRITGLDPASPESRRPMFIIERLPSRDSWVRDLFMDERDAIRKAFFNAEWF